MDSAALEADPSVVEEPVAVGRTYIDDIISRASDRAVTSASVALVSISGHHPTAVSRVTATAAGIMNPVNGRAIRLVRRKYIGNVPKCR